MIVCYGRSYGGFMVVACLTEYPTLWAAAVDFVGIANWITFLENDGDYRRSHCEAEYGSLEEDREFLESISPIHTVDRIECPLFIQHGENDPSVPVDEARQIAAAVAEQGTPVETCPFEDEGHHTTKLENRVSSSNGLPTSSTNTCNRPVVSPGLDSPTAGFEKSADRSHDRITAASRPRTL